MDLNQAVEDYIERNEITFELRAVNGDGEVVLQETSTFNFEDVSGYASLLDERLEAMVVNAANIEAEPLNDTDFE